MRVMILRVVSTPTSELTRISSRLSKTSSSTLDFPAMAFVNFEKKVVFDFSRPLSKVSFFSDENIFLKKLIFFMDLLMVKSYVNRGLLLTVNPASTLFCRFLKSEKEAVMKCREQKTVPC